MNNVFAISRQAMKFYPLASPQQRARQAVRYARAVGLLGDKWLLAKHSQRLQEPRPV